MKNMPNSSGHSSCLERWPTKPMPPLFLRSKAWLAAPAMKNSSDSRHGELSCISGSMAVLAAALLTCQSQLT